MTHLSEYVPALVRSKVPSLSCISVFESGLWKPDSFALILRDGFL